MRLKSELYKKEQEEIVDKIIKILNLENNNIINLCDLDNEYDKQKQIMELIPEIRKYNSFNGIKTETLLIYYFTEMCGFKSSMV